VTLNEALALINKQPGDGSLNVYFLVCGCQSLHLATLLQAHLLKRLPRNQVQILTGFYGDFSGNLAKAAESNATSAAVVVEWSDIDPRLGLRSSGGWSAQATQDILATCRQRLAHFRNEVRKLGARMPVAWTGPTLPLPPIGNTIRAQKSVVELDLEQQLALFQLDIAQIPGVRVINPACGDQLSSSARLDARMELLAGFPYTIPAANALASCLVEVLHQPSPKKGLITDLDETLWAGIVGEVGPEGVSWHQEHHTQTHGLYQQMLGHLADCGVLVGACSKNELSTVQAALARTDLFFNPETLFPVYASWNSKSASVAETLRVWNINEDAVVFIDDNPMELSEVQRAFPGMTCLQFPGNQPAKGWNFLGDLADLFGKPLVLEEDRLRLASIRAAAELRDIGAQASSPEFLSSLQGVVTVSWRKDPSDKRPLELINKTNQFNLNGLRIGEGDWQRSLERPETVLAVISYQDKFGPLGKIAVLAGSQCGTVLRVSSWVMSCRAFSRRIEHHTLDALFQRFNVQDIHFTFAATERNQPLQEFFHALGVAPGPEGEACISRVYFKEHCGVLPHQVSSLTE